MQGCEPENVVRNTELPNLISELFGWGTLRVAHSRVEEPVRMTHYRVEEPVYKDGSLHGCGTCKEGSL